MSVDEARVSLTLRAPLPEDEFQVAAAQAELAEEGFNFSLGYPALTWEEYLRKVERDHAGLDLPPGRVPSTMLFAVVDSDIVGRIHIRHELNSDLQELGGHIGYAVRPAYRRQGYATEMLRLGLENGYDFGIRRALVTCDDDNLGSIATIERCGGVLENIISRSNAARKRRYWVDIS